MGPHRLVTTVCAALLGAPPLATPPLVTPPLAAPSPSPAQSAPAFQPCPMTPQALAVSVPPSALPPPPPREPGPTVGGGGLATAGLTLPPEAPPLPTSIAARSWLVADLDTGKVLGACGPHERHSPASVQKLLLAATLLPKLDPKQVVDAVPADLNIERGSSALGLVPGGHYPVETLWLGLLLVSGNDTAQALARLGGGADGVPGTMRAMNDLAHQLGARDTTAVTPSGLDAPGQFTSVYDLALIARVCLGIDDFRRYATTPTAQVPPQPPKDPRGFQIQNENKLVASYPGALGGKTGFTNASRHSYVGAAERNGHRLVVTMLDGEAVPLRPWQQGAALLDWGFSVVDRDGAGTGVGRLVAPGELDATPEASGRAAPAGKNASDGTGATPGGGGGRSPLLSTPVLLTVAALTWTSIGVLGTTLALRALRRRRLTRSRGHHRPR